MTPDPIPEPDSVCEGGDLDCGSGLLLILREAMQPLAAGGVLEVRSNDASVAVDLPAWCRLVGHGYLEARQGTGRSTSHFLRKKGAVDEELEADRRRAREHRWSVRARSKSGLTARVYARNHSFDVGQPASFDTEDEAPSALEHLLGALAACLAVGLRWRASQRGIEVFELEVQLSARLSDPFVFLGTSDGPSAGLEGIQGRLFVDADADDALLEQLWRDTLARSPVTASLRDPLPIVIERRSQS